MRTALHDIPSWSRLVSVPTTTIAAWPGQQPGRRPRRAGPAGAFVPHAAIASLPTIESTGIRGKTALPLTLLAGLLIGPGAHAQQAMSSRQQVAMTVDEITAEANARSAAGTPAADVEAWIEQAMDQAGLSVRKPPESWDVYGQARWNRTAAAQTQAAETRDEPEPDDAQARILPRQGDPDVDYYVYQQPGLGAQDAADPANGVHDAGATETGTAPP